MFKAASWALVVVAFCVLSGYKSHVPDVAVNHLQGAQVMTSQKINPHQQQLVSVVGRVVSTRKNDRGQTNISFEADDGTPLTITIAPTVAAIVPKAGTRAQIEGQVIVPGVISIPNRWNIKALAPSYKTPSREVIKGRLNYISGGNRGVLANISHEEYHVATVFIPSQIFETSMLGRRVTLTGYRQKNNTIYVEEVL